MALTKALLRAARLLDLPNSALARALGVSNASIYRLGAGTRTIDPDSKEGEFALLLIRIYHSLDRLVGTDADQRKAWVHGYNRALNGRPAELIERVGGLVSVLNYVEAMAEA